MFDPTPLQGHQRVALSLSGGKDSLACLYLLRDHLDKITVYHYDTGDLLPEIRAVVAHARTLAPRFVSLQGDIEAAIARDGLPTDLLPHSAHPVGQAMGEGVKLVGRYDCCFKNLMWPVFSRIRDDGNTLLIRGTKTVDINVLPARSGDQLGDNLFLWLPLQDWSNDQVFTYLRDQGAPIARIYDHQVNAPECARCSAWWNEGRNEYLRSYHPALWRQYRERLAVVAQAIEEPLRYLRREHLEQED